MGRVAVTYNLMPEGTAVDMMALKEKVPGMVPAGVQVARSEVKPFAFGLKILEIICIMNDVEGIMEQLEEKLRSLEGIQTVETTGVTLI